MSTFRQIRVWMFFEPALGLLLMTWGVYIMEPAQPSKLLAALGGGMYAIGILYFRDIVVSNVKRFLT